MRRGLGWTLMGALLAASTAAAQSQSRGDAPPGRYPSAQPRATGPYGQPVIQPYSPPAGWEADRYPSQAQKDGSIHPRPTPPGPGNYQSPNDPDRGYPARPGAPSYPNLPTQPRYVGNPRYANPQGYPAQNPPLSQPYPPVGGQARPGYPGQGPASAVPPRPANAPFTLTAQEQARLERLLQVWEQASSQVKRYRAKFVRWKYDDTFHRDKPLKDQGHVRYIAPDRVLYEVDGDNGRPEKLICDGKTIYQFDFSQKILIEYPMPPELQGQAITHGPLPFLFSSKAATLKKRYFLREITPPNVQGQIWLEAYPRYQVDAAEFQKAQVILNTKDMRPEAVRLYLPGGNERTVHQVYDVVANDPLHFLQGDISRPSTPAGWSREVPQPAAPQAARPAPHDSRRQPRRW